MIGTDGLSDEDRERLARLLGVSRRELASVARALRDVFAVSPSDLVAVLESLALSTRLADESASSS